jgi:DMSO reductase anchor subunit
MCLPRLEEGRTPACVDACPTFAITVEKVNVAEWRQEHSAGDAPNLPSVELTLSTTRFSLPADVPLETYGGSEWSLRPEDPHWPLVWLTLLTQAAVGASATASSGSSRAIAAVAALAALGASLLHLGRPAHAWKALRNLRRSWLSREVALFGAYGALATVTVLLPLLAPVTVGVGAAGVYASGRLYVVPGRPAWHTPLTIVRFGATALAVGPLLTGHPRWALVGIVLQLVALTANLLRLRRDPRIEWWGSVRLTLGWFGVAFWLGVAAWAGGAVLASTGHGLLALPLVAGAELVGRYLFYVTVVPLDMPGSFARTSRTVR